MNTWIRMRILLVSFVTLISACEGGVSVDIAGPTIGSFPEISEPVTSIGVATDNGDLRVNGVRYNTRSATVQLNGTTVATTSLQSGHYVHITGRIHGLGLEGTAEYITVESNLIGPIESADSPGNRLVVLGHVVNVGANTYLGTGINSDGIAGIPLGTVLEISGYTTSDGQLAATRIDIVPYTSSSQIVGKVTDISLAAMSLRIGQLEVDFSNSRHIALPQGGPREGGYVIVRGTLAGGVLLADELLGVPGMTGSDVFERTYIDGFVTDVFPDGQFELGAVRIAIHATTNFRNGSRDGLEVDAQTRVYGRVGADGVTIDADTIEYLSLVDWRP